MAIADPKELPPDIRERIRADWGNEAARVEEMLFREFGCRSDMQIIRCVLFLAHGDRQKLDRALELARTDWRDLIVSAEYDPATGRQIRSLDMPFK